MDKVWNRLSRWFRAHKSTAIVPELSRSQYSLVSCSEFLTPGAIAAWETLPDEVKNDPTLAAFKLRYEQEHGDVTKKGIAPKIKRLPLVKSEPHLKKDNISNVEDLMKIETCGINETSEHMVPAAAPPTKSKISQAKYLTKLVALVGLWIFFTVVCLLYDENVDIYRHTAVSPNEVKDYVLDFKGGSLSLKVELQGPFFTEQMQEKLNSTEMETRQYIAVWLERRFLRNVSGEGVVEQNSARERCSSWRVYLKDNDIDFLPGESRRHVLQIGPSEPNAEGIYALRFNSTASQVVSIAVNYKYGSMDPTDGLIYAALLLLGLYVLIIFEIVNRTMAAIIMSSTSIAVLALVGERPSLPELASWLDFETLLLLFSMMILVAITAETGLFDFLAVYCFEITKGRIWPLLNILWVTTALISTFLDNVTTILLMAPVAIRLCEVTGLDPIQILIGMVLYSNIGGTATPVGDPPNVIIASNRAVIQSGINFGNFTLHMGAGILVVCIQTYLQLRYLHIDAKKLRTNEPTNIKNIRRQITIWRRAADSLMCLSEDEQFVKDRLERKIRKLTDQMLALRQESVGRACSKETFQNTLDELKQKFHIRDIPLLMKTSFVIAFVIILFFLHAVPEINRISLGWTALSGAILLLLLTDREDLEPILHRVEWSTLLFFAALFVFMEALSILGLIQFIGKSTESLILTVAEDSRLTVAILLILWVSGIMSSLVDNIPLTTMMVRVVSSIGANPNLNLPFPPLVWALSLGACLGGNGTLIAASANVVCAGVAEQHGYKFSFMQFLRIGLPITIGHLVAATIYLLVCHCLFSWH